MVGLRPSSDPLLEAVGTPEQVEYDLHGFPALHGTKPKTYCDVYVKTAATQGFAVLYRSDDEPCDGAVAVAEQVAQRVRG